MNLRTIFIGFALMMGLAFSGCSDDDDNCVQDYSGPLEDNETLLVGEWSLSAITSDVALDLTDDEVENPSTNIYDQYTDCDKDARYVFAEDRNYDFGQGTVVPNCDNKLITSGSWQYDGQQINFTSSCTLISLPIVFINGNTSFKSVNENLLIKDASGQVVTATWTFAYTKNTP